MKRLFLLLALVVFVIGCAQPGTQVPGIFDKKALGHVAVVPLIGPDGVRFADLFAKQLSNYGVTALGGTEVLAIMQNNGLRMGDFTNGTVDLRGMGELLGVDVLAIGTISVLTDKVTGKRTDTVSAVAIQFLDASSGRVVTYANHQHHSDIISKSHDYAEVAEIMARTGMGD